MNERSKKEMMSLFGSAKLKTKEWKGKEKPIAAIAWSFAGNFGKPIQ